MGRGEDDRPRPEDRAAPWQECPEVAPGRLRADDDAGHGPEGDQADQQGHAERALHDYADARPGDARHHDPEQIDQSPHDSVPRALSIARGPCSRNALLRRDLSPVGSFAESVDVNDALTQRRIGGSYAVGMELVIAQPSLARRTDEQLAEAFVAGDDASFEALVARYGGPIYAFILRMVGRPEDADDLAQDVFVQLLKSLPGAREGLPLRPWVYVIARNKCLDFLKRKRPLLFSALGDPDSEESVADRVADAGPLPDELAERADLRALLADAIEALPPKYRQVVALRYSSDLTFAEMGAVLGLPENTVKTHFQRAKVCLRERLNGAL